MATEVEKSIEVGVPVSTAYNQWTQFEEFPRFMGGVREVRQLDDRRLHWVAEIAGVRREWEAEIIEQVAAIPGVAGVHVMAFGYERGVPELLRRSGVRTETTEATRHAS